MKLMKKTFVMAGSSCCFCNDFCRGSRSIVDKALNIKKPDFNHSIIEMDLINKSGKIEEHRIIDELYRHNQKDRHF